MDWAKAKTYLIIAFAVTNIIMIISLAGDYGRQDKGYFTKEALSSLQILLEKNDIDLTIDLPKDTPKMGNLSIEYEDIDSERFKQLFEDHSDDIDIIAEKKMVLIAEKSLPVFDIETAKAQTEAFIEKYDLKEDYEFKYADSEPDLIQIFYSSKYKDRFLENSYMMFEYTDSDRFRFERLRMHVIEESRTKKKVMTSAEALIKATALIEPGQAVEEIELGYNYAQYESLPIAKTKTATAAPSWRIRTSDGNYYYIEALEL